MAEAGTDIERVRVPPLPLPLQWEGVSRVCEGVRIPLAF